MNKWAVLLLMACCTRAGVVLAAEALAEPDYKSGLREDVTGPDCKSGLREASVEPDCKSGLREDVAAGFAAPPASARPWVYWFWMNGNITREGITADLEAMNRAGIGGALIMEVGQTKHQRAQMAPAGTVAFGSPQWLALFAFTLAEASRLGLQINMNNDAGWCGSGGPWNLPEFSMQKLAWTTTVVDGPRRFDAALPEPKARRGSYRDFKTLAFPSPETEHAPADVPLARVLDVTSHVDASGRLTWEVPSGRWMVRRIGHASTGRTNHPAPEAGVGLECDKFSAEATGKRQLSWVVAVQMPRKRGILVQTCDSVNQTARGSRGSIARPRMSGTPSTQRKSGAPKVNFPKTHSAIEGGRMAVDTIAESQPEPPPQAKHAGSG